MMSEPEAKPTSVFVATITLGNLITGAVMLISLSLAYGELRASDEAFAMQLVNQQREFDDAMVETRRVRPEMDIRLRAVEAVQAGGLADSAALRREMQDLKVQIHDLANELRKANAERP